MNKLLFPAFLAVVFLLPTNGTAQVRNESFRSTESKVQIEKLASHELQNLFPDFVEAQLYYSDRKMNILLNYNLLYNQFYFEDRGGLRTLDRLDQLDSIRIGDYVFGHIRDSGFFELSSTDMASPLLRRHMIDITTDVVAVGAFGTTDRTASIDAVQSFSGVAEGELLDRTISLDNPGGQEMRITLRRQEQYHILKNGKPIAVNSRRTLLREFDEYRTQLRDYLRRNDVDFDSREDMARLAGFIGSLPD